MLRRVSGGMGLRNVCCSFKKVLRSPAPVPAMQPAWRAAVRRFVQPEKALARAGMPGLVSDGKTYFGTSAATITFPRRMG